MGPEITLSSASSRPWDLTGRVVRVTASFEPVYGKALLGRTDALHVEDKITSFFLLISLFFYYFSFYSLEGL